VADIDIQRRSSNALLWLVTVIALLLCIWLLFGRPSGQTPAGRAATSAPTATLLPVVSGPVAGASHDVASVAPLVSESRSFT
jgi:hypothetical protein